MFEKKKGDLKMKEVNEVEIRLEHITDNVVYMSKEIYKSIKKDKKKIEQAYNIKIKKRK